MTKAELKAKRRANRSMKRQAEHAERMVQEQVARNNKIADQFNERLEKRNKYGNKDLTAFYGILNAERPADRRVYGKLV